MQYVLAPEHDRIGEPVSVPDPIDNGDHVAIEAELELELDTVEQLPDPLGV